MSRLLEELEELNNPNQVFDSDGDETAARLNHYDSDGSEIEIGKSKLKISKNIEQMEDNYAGKIVKLGHESPNEEFSEIEDDMENSYEDEEHSSNGEEFSEHELGGDEEQLKVFAQSDHKKVEALRLQLSLIDALLTCRIKLQKILQIDPLMIDREALLNLKEKFGKILDYFTSLDLHVNDILTDNFQRTNLTSKFSKFEQNPVEQIENIGKIFYQKLLCQPEICNFLKIFPCFRIGPV